MIDEEPLDQMVRTWRSKKRNGGASVPATFSADKRVPMVRRAARFVLTKCRNEHGETHSDSFPFVAETMSEQCAVGVKDACLEVPQQESIITDLPKDCCLDKEYSF